MKKLKPYQLLLLCQFLLLLLVLFLLRAPVLEPDSSSYLLTAQNLLASGFFSENGMSPMYYRTPGYPLFLAAVQWLFGGLTAVVFLQVLMNVLAAFLLYKSLLIATERKDIALLGLGAFCAEFIVYAYAASLLPESLFLASISFSLFFLSLWMKDTARLAPFAGLYLSLMAALLVKPAMMYLCALLCPLLILFVLLRRVKITQAALYLVLFAAVFGGWSYRNYVHSGHLFYSNIRHVQFFRWDARVLKTRVEGIPLSAADDYFERELAARLAEKHLPVQPLAGRDELNAGASKGAGKGSAKGSAKDSAKSEVEGRDKNLNEVEVGLIEREIGREYVRAHFVEYLRMNVSGLGKLLIGPGASYIDRLISWRPAAMTMKLLAACWSALVHLVYAAGLIHRRRGLRAIDVIVLFAVLYLAAGHASLGYSRYRITFYPLVVFGAARLWDDVRSFSSLITAARQRLFGGRMR